MISVDFKGMREAQRDLQTYAKRAVPYAARNGLNRGAFAGQTEWRGEIKRAFVLRNQFTVRSVQVAKARTLDMRTMVAVLGSVAPYMGTQESGGRVRGRTGKKAIPGPVAAGQRPGSKRTRLVRAASRLSAIRVARLRSMPRAQRNAVAIAMAKRRGDKHVLLSRPRGGVGLFLLAGGKRKIATKLLWDVSRSSVRVPPSHTLQRALKSLGPKLERIHHDALLEQLKRHKVFGY